jgi:hypothetical protein
MVLKGFCVNIFRLQLKQTSHEHHDTLGLRKEFKNACIFLYDLKYH